MIVTVLQDESERTVLQQELRLKRTNSTAMRDTFHRTPVVTTASSSKSRIMSQSVSC